MKKIFLNALIIVIILIFTSCSMSSIENSDSINDKPSNEVLLKEEKLIKNMTLEEKIGQLFIIRPDSLDFNIITGENTTPKVNGVTELNDQMIEALKKYNVGGVVIFQKNILSPIQLTNFVDAMKNQSNIPLFVGIDEEGGSVARIANSKAFDVTKYESMETIGLTEDSKIAEDVGITIGSYLKEYGFNLDFAPVADVNTNPENIVIGNRSFGSDPELVSKMVSAEIDGFHEVGIMCCIKHFPGHGDTKGDTHKGFVSTDKTWNEIKESELIPFINSSAKTDMIMISHITASNITTDGLPSSLSNEMIEGKLRNEMGYDGVVITDSMAMGAIKQEYTSSTGAVKAILAGADIILIPENFVEAYNGIYDAVKDGTISEKRIDESVLRILTLKEKYGLLTNFKLN